MSSIVTSFFARDEVTGEEVQASFSDAAQVISFNEDGSANAKVIYMEGDVSLVINFELDIKSLIPAPDKDRLAQQEDFFSAWNQPSGSGVPSPPQPYTPRLPGGR